MKLGNIIRVQNTFFVRILFTHNIENQDNICARLNTIYKKLTFSAMKNILQCNLCKEHYRNEYEITYTIKI